MKITDGKKTVDIEMKVWEGSGFSPDWSMDFFDAGSLPYNEETETYTVDDVDYCIEQAEDWENSRGDFSDDVPNENRRVFVIDITDDDEEEITLKISKIAIKSETFCTHWNGNLYCVDICEDAEERSAWLYNAAYGVKSLMWGEKINQSSRDEFLDMVFSSLPDYIEDYAEEYED